MALESDVVPKDWWTSLTIPLYKSKERGKGVIGLNARIIKALVYKASFEKPLVGKVHRVTDDEEGRLGPKEE